MRLKMNTKNLVIAALLTALSIIIPMISFRLPMPSPFSVTFASHVPVMLAMFISPATAAMVGVGSTLGFLLRGSDPVIVARAAMHIIFAVVGATLYRQGMSVYLVLGITMFIHAFAEALIVLPFGWTLQKAGFAVGLVTIFHHAVDGVLTLGVYAALEKAGFFARPIKKEPIKA